MAKQKIHDAVADTLVQMGVEVVTVDTSRRHPRVLWSDRGGTLKGIITCSSTASDYRSILNAVATARRQVRLARGE
jgi:hypothetical protein